MSAQPTIPTRSTLIPLGFIWGALVGLGVTLLVTIIPAIITALVYPNVGEETWGYTLVIFPGLYCLVIFVPLITVSALIGFAFALYLNRQSRRVSNIQIAALGIVTGLAIYAIALGSFLYLATGSVTGAAGPTNTDGIIGAIIWLVPPPLLLMAGYSLLASWLNRRLPA